MSSPRKLPRGPEERNMRLGQRMSLGTVAGRVESAAPVGRTPVTVSTEAESATGDITEHIEFTITGTLAVSTGTVRWYCPYAAAVIEDVIAGVNTAPTGASIKVDVNKNGTTIFTDQANRPTIAIGANEGISAGVDVDALSSDDYLQVDVDQVGSTAAGANLVVVIKIRLLGTDAGSIQTLFLVSESDGSPSISDATGLIFLQSDSLTNLGGGVVQVDNRWLIVSDSDGSPTGRPLVLRFPSGSVADIGNGMYAVTFPSSGSSLIISDSDGSPTGTPSVLVFPPGTLYDGGNGYYYVINWAGGGSGGWAGTWTTYTPTWTGSVSNPAIGNGTITGAYSVNGKTLFFRIYILMGSTTTFGSGNYSFGLPAGFTAIASIEQSVHGRAFDSSASTRYPLTGDIGAAGTTIVRAGSGPAGALVSQTSPFTWATSDIVNFNGVIEVQ